MAKLISLLIFFFGFQNLEFDKIYFDKLIFSEDVLKKKVKKELVDRNAFSIQNEGFSYTIKGDTAYLSYIDFYKSDSINLKYNDIKFNRNTNLNEIKKIFPKSYKNRNYGTSSLLLEVETEKHEYDYINIYSYSRRVKILQLVFIDQKLYHADITYLNSK